MNFSFALCAYLAAIVSAATPSYNSKAFDNLFNKRQSTVNQSSSSLVVDLGYERYMGAANASTGLHTWKGLIPYSPLWIYTTLKRKSESATQPLLPDLYDGSRPKHHQ